MSLVGVAGLAPFAVAEQLGWLHFPGVVAPARLVLSGTVVGGVAYSALLVTVVGLLALLVAYQHLSVAQVAVTKIRGRVVHAGYRPSEEEATVAVSLLGVVKAQMAEKRLKYRRTALLLLGQPGLEHRGLYSGKIKKFVEQEAEHEDPWIASYRKWLKL